MFLAAKKFSLMTTISPGNGDKIISPRNYWWIFTWITLAWSLLKIYKFQQQYHTIIKNKAITFEKAISNCEERIVIYLLNSFVCLFSLFLLSESCTYDNNKTKYIMNIKTKYILMNIYKAAYRTRSGETRRRLNLAY